MVTTSPGLVRRGGGRTWSNSGYFGGEQEMARHSSGSCIPDPEASGQFRHLATTVSSPREADFQDQEILSVPSAPSRALPARSAAAPGYFSGQGNTIAC